MIRTTEVISNDENPKWPGIGEPLYFGVQESGQPYNVEVFDEDAGFELFPNLADDLLGSATDYIFACSSLDVQTPALFVDDRAPYDYGEIWAYNKRCDGDATTRCTFNDDCQSKLCEGPYSDMNTIYKRGIKCLEAAWIPLIPDAAPNYCDGEDAICLQIRMDILPLSVTNIEVNEADANGETLKTRASAVINDEVLTGTKFSMPYVDDAITLINGRTLGGWAGARGGMIVQTFKNSRAVNNKSPNFITFTVNLDCEIFIFRENDANFRGKFDGDARPLAWMEAYEFEYDIELEAKFPGQADTEVWSGWRKKFKNDPDDPSSPQFPLTLTFGGNNNVVEGEVDINGIPAGDSNPDSHYIIIIKSINTRGKPNLDFRKFCRPRLSSAFIAISIILFTMGILGTVILLIFLVRESKEQIVNRLQVIRHRMRRFVHSIFPYNGIYDNEMYIVVGIFSYEDAEAKGFLFRSESEFNDFREWYYKNYKNILLPLKPDVLLEAFQKEQQELGREFNGDEWIKTKVEQA